VLEALEEGFVEPVPALDLVRQAAATASRPSPATERARQVAATTMVGMLLNDTYRVEGHLASGAMGAVFEARHVRTGRQVAIKTLLVDALGSPQAIKRFGREARAASALGHPGIVPILDFDVDSDGTHFIVMELLRGERGERGERAVLLDFGLARSIDAGGGSRVTMAGEAVGTPAYMSPEQARGEDLDARSDVHALGAVLYEMLTGEPPFMDHTLVAELARLLMQPVRPLADAAAQDLPAELDQVVQRALAKDREGRFESVGQLAGELRRILDAVGDGAGQSGMAPGRQDGFKRP
jgi:serine/threonine-protein kinase